MIPSSDNPGYFILVLHEFCQQFLLSRILDGILSHEWHKPISIWHSYCFTASFENKLCMIIMHHQGKATTVILSSDSLVHLSICLCVCVCRHIYTYFNPIILPQFRRKLNSSPQGHPWVTLKLSFLTDMYMHSLWSLHSVKYLDYHS